MGFDYSYVLWVPEAELWPLLDSVAANSKLHEKPLEVTLSEGEIKQWPFSSYYDQENRYHSAPVASLQISKLKTLCVCASIFFAQDEPIQSYAKDWQEDVHLDSPDWQLPFDEEDRLAIGCIYISVQMVREEHSQSDKDSGCIRVDFTAATTDMSLLFTRSQSIQQTFLKLMQKHHGLCCFLDQEASGMVLWLDGQSLQEYIPGSPDSLAELRALVKANAPGNAK